MQEKEVQDEILECCAGCRLATAAGCTIWRNPVAQWRKLGGCPNKPRNASSSKDSKIPAARKRVGQQNSKQVKGGKR